MPFDAGAIEATMTLDRTPFRRGLRASRREAEDFANERFAARLDVDTTAARAALRTLRADIARTQAAAARANATAGATRATAAMPAVQAAQRRVQAQAGGSSTTVAVGADTAAASARIAALEAQLAALNRTRAEPKIRVRGAARATAQVGILKAAMIGLGPAVVPVAAAATGGIMAYAGALGAAAAAAGVFGIAAAGSVMEIAATREQVAQLDEQIKAAEPGSAAYNELIAQRTELLDKLSPAQDAVLSSLDALTKEFKAFGSAAQPEILGTFRNTLDGLRRALVVLKPAVEPVSLVFLQLSERFKDAMNGPGMKTFRDWIMTNGPPAILFFAQTLINLGFVVANLVTAFQPLTNRLVKTEGAFAGLRAATAGLSSSPQFQEFLRYIIANGPLVSSTLLAIIDALAQVAWALAPVAPYILIVVRAVAEFVAGVAQAHPWVIQLAWAGLLLRSMWGPVVAVLGTVNTLLKTQAGMWLLAKARMVAYRVAMVAVRTATLLWTAAQWLLNTALWANPIGLIVLAIVAAVALIVGAVLYAWNNFDWFRTGVLAVWDAIKAGAMWLYTNGIKPAFDLVVGAFNWLMDHIWVLFGAGPIGAIIAFAVLVYQNFDKIRAAAVWMWTNGIQPVVNWVVSAFNNFLLPAVQLLVGFWVFSFRKMWGVVQALWTFIKPIIDFVVLVGFGLLMIALGVLVGFWKSAFRGMRTVVLWLWRNAVKPAVDGIVWLWNNFLMPYMRAARTMWGVIMRAIGAVARWLWQKVISPVVGWIVGRWRWLVERFQAYRATLAVIFRIVGSYVALLRDRFKAGFQKIKDFASDLLSNLRGMRDSVKSVFRAVANHARKPINWVINTVYNDGIRAVASRVLNAVGMSKQADKLPRADTIPAFAGGGPVDPRGFVRGAGGPTSDDIFARIANREFVVNARSTARYRPVLEWINNQGRRAGGNSAAAVPAAAGAMPAMAGGGLLDRALGFAKDAVLGASKSALNKAFDTLGLDSWISRLKSGPPVWESAAGGALDMATTGLLSFLDKKDKEGGNATAVVKAARRARMEGSDYNNRYTRAFGMPGAPWCAMFVSEMIKDAKAQKMYKNIRSAAVASFANSSLATVRPSAGRPGDLAVYSGAGPGGWQHINIVTDPRRRQSIGGNESDAIRTQYGYYTARAAVLKRPVPKRAQGGMITHPYLRSVLAQDYDQNTRAQTPDQTKFLRMMAGLPPYSGGGEVAHRARGGRLSAGQVAWVGEDGPELVRMGASGGVTRSDRSIEQMAKAFLSALEQWRRNNPDSGRGRGGGGVTINGLATTEAVRALSHREAVAAAAELGGTARPGAPGPDPLEGM